MSHIILYFLIDQSLLFGDNAIATLLYYSGLKKICFRSVNDLHILKKELSKKNNYVVVRNEIISKLPFKVFIKHKGIKYSILKSKPN